MNTMSKGFSTTKLLRFIGSPFVEESQSAVPEEDEILPLYRLATINKIGFLYLDKLRKCEKLGNLRSEYIRHQRNYELLLNTAGRLYEILLHYRIPCAIFKTIIPFLAIPSDVDVLILDGDKDHQKAIRVLKRERYYQFDSIPHCVSFHDSRDCQHQKSDKKDPYDVDLYKEIAANYIVYFDKDKIRKYLCNQKLEGVNRCLTSFRPEVELAIQLVHSIFPEQLYLLYHYYLTLFYLREIDYRFFIKLARENKVTFAIRKSLGITAELHRLTHGFIFPKLSKIIEEMEYDLTQANRTTNLPYRFSFLDITKVLLEKLNETKAAKSMIMQIMGLCYPQKAGHVVTHLVIRRTRETY